MKRDLDLGFIALTDAAPLIVARELGYFAEEGLDVTLRREVSWATIRDKVTAGVYQGAHMLAPMLLAENLHGVGDALIAPLSLNAHGAAVGVSRGLAADMEALAPSAPLLPAALAAVVAARRARADAPLCFAVVFPTSMHNYILRYWAASAGIDPDNDIRIVVAPPIGIAARLKSGEIDGFCVGAPWPALCEEEFGARIAIDAGVFWPGGPDKVLGLSKAWADRHTDSALALTRAVLRGALWADADGNAGELAKLLARADHVGAPAALLSRRIGSGAAANLRFARYATSFPWRSQAAWIVAQMLRWGQIDPNAEFSRALDAYRPDLFREAADALGVSAPLADTKIEGAHEIDWVLPGVNGPIPMARDRLFDDRVFDPATIRETAASFPFTRAKA